MNSSDILQVDIQKLGELATYLNNEGFDKDFTALSNKMSELTDNWMDLEGEHFKNVFVSFMSDAKKINDSVVKLGQFANEMANNYQTTLSEHAEELNRVLSQKAGGYMYNLTNVGDIGVYYEGVTSVLSDVTALYNELKSKIDELNSRKDHVGDYWISEEASNFVGQMDGICKSFDDFCSHYDNFIELLQKVMQFYEMEEESILTALEKYKGVN